MLDTIIKKTHWYKNKYGDAVRIMQAPYGLDIISLGSNPSKYSIDFSESNLRGYSFAVGPQTLEFDLKILKNYYDHLSYLGPRIVLFVLCPFGTCKSVYREMDGEVYKNVRYYQILPKEDIPNYDETLKITRILHPSQYVVRNLKSFLVNEAIETMRREKGKILTSVQMEKSAEIYINNWKREFQLDDLNPDHISDYVKSSVQYNKVVLDEVATFCKFHNLQPIIVIPPLSKELNAMIPNEFKECFTYSVIRRNDIPLLDYSQDERYCVNTNFLDALKMNKGGRRLFTRLLVDDLVMRGYCSKRQ